MFLKQGWHVPFVKQAERDTPDTTTGFDLSTGTNVIFTPYADTPSNEADMLPPAITFGNS